MFDSGALVVRRPCRACARGEHGIIDTHFALAAFVSHSCPPLFELLGISGHIMTLTVWILTTNFISRAASGVIHDLQM